ncbi:lectin-like domain-containing protein [Hyphomicrobium sp. DY-1]|uniref:lectin-like domain-containing protein n=1 Tax=Hyphomicrobium sp. DY-1 TaxID=3075650 RepID=UPI0039C3DB82
MSSGSWSDVAPWPIVAIHSVMTPDGKILTFGTDQKGVQGSHMLYDLWDPATGVHTTLSYTQNTNIFCSCCVIDPITDHIIITGGDASTLGNVNGGVPYVHTFDYQTDQLTQDKADSLHYSRWYATTITLADGRILALGGYDAKHLGVGTPEIYTSGSGWQTLPSLASADIANHWFYPRAWVSSSGAIFGFSTSADGSYAGALFKITTDGISTLTQAGHTPFASERYDPATMFAEDKILTIDKNGNAWIMDISGETPTFTQTAALGSNRAWSNLTNLADGTILLTGGSNGLGPGGYGNIATQTNRAMIWNPDTGQWTNDSSAAIGRFYHSTAILLTDGTVLSAGGGAPGPLTNLNSEIYTPGYLLNSDGSLRTDRPVITNAPQTLQQGQTFTLTLDNADVIQKLELVKFGSTTHAFDAEQRSFDLTFTHIDAHTLQVTLPSNVNALTNGHWMLFANNNNGTPSIAATIKISQFGVDTSAPSITGTNLMLNGTASHVFGSDVYTLNVDSGGQTGSVMSDKRIDLTHDFGLSFSIYLGAKGAGGDGMAFVLHNDAFGNDAIGLGGDALGANGLRNGIAIQFDTFQNISRGDIATPHTGFVDTDLNAATYRLSSQTELDALTDGQWHSVNVIWNASDRSLSYTFDGNKIGKLELTAAQFASYFGRSNYAYFGVTGASGSVSALHQVQFNSISATFETDPPPGTAHPHDGSIFDVTTIDQHVTVNGSAIAQPDAQHTLTLTPDAQFKAGSALFNDKVDLTHDFNIAFSIYFAPGQPADGMAFVLHNDPNGADAVGKFGGGLGALGLQNGLAIEFDTYRNGAPFNDPAYNHTNIVDTDAGPGANLTKPTNIGNIVNGGWHQVGVTWDADAHLLRYWVDGKLGGTLTGDIATKYLGGQSTAYMGFTGATGGADDLQQVRVSAVDAYFENVSHNYANILDPIALSNSASLNGSATYNSATHTFVLTPDTAFQAGSAMLNQRVDLSYDFQISFDLYLGKNAAGADGMSFVLQNDPRGESALGAAGGGYGAAGIQNGFGIAFDTYQNANLGDIAADHTNFFNTSAPLALGRISNQLSLGNGMVTDGQWHNVLVSWDATDHTLTYWFDGVQKASLNQDIVATYEGGSQYAYLGFAAGTGGAHNLQQVRIDSLTATLEPPLPPGRPHDGSIFDVTTIDQHVTVNGSAIAQPDAQHTLTLTPDAQFKAGSALFNDKVDLTHDFNIAFSIYFAPGQPADGMAFVLHNDPNGADAVGKFGGGLGALGLQNGLAIEFDTYRNGAPFNDPAYNHTNIVDTDAGPGANLTKPTNIGNIVNGGWHQVGVTWDADAHLLRYWVDGKLGGTLTGDIATKYLGGQSTAYMGFTGATGGADDLQQVRVSAVDAYFENVSHNYANILDPIALSNSASLNGSATYNSATHTFVLTPDTAFQAGSAMLNQRVDLSYDFQISFDLYLGKNAAGADGMSFVLQNDPRGESALGAAGGGYGAAGIQNGFGIAFDTYQNANLGDIAADHTNFFNTSAPLALGRISNQLSLGNGMVTDGQWHNVLVSWDATDHTLTYWFDGVQKASLNQDIVATYEGGSQYAYLGFAAGTGGAHNLQQVRIDSLTATLEDHSHIIA